MVLNTIKQNFLRINYEFNAIWCTRSWKRNQAKFLIEKYNIPKSQLRYFKSKLLIKQIWEWKQKIYMDEGKLVPDSTIIGNNQR